MSLHALRRTILILLGVGSLALSSSAAVIQQIKGKRVLIQMEGLNTPVGSELFALNAEQKRRAIVRLTAIRAGRAIGEVIQGNVQAGMQLVVKSAGPNNNSSTAFSPVATRQGRISDAPVSEDTAAALARRYKKGFGILGGIAMSQASLNARASVAGTLTEQALAMKGTSYNLKAIYDYHMSRGLTIRAAAGYETLALSASVPSNKQVLCTNSTTCTLSLNYLSLEAAAQYNLTTGPTRVWVGAGYAFLLAMSKTNTITNLEATSTNQALLASAGVDIPMGTKGYIPLVAEYGIFPFAGISMSGMYLRAGYAWHF